MAAKYLPFYEIERDNHHDGLIFFEEKKGVGEWIEDCVGIPLSPEILKCAGFVNGIFRLSEFTSLRVLNNGHVGLYYETWFAWAEFQYFHELQNAIYFLTGSEIKIK